MTNSLQMPTCASSRGLIQKSTSSSKAFRTGSKVLAIGWGGCDGTETRAGFGGGTGGDGFGTLDLGAGFGLWALAGSGAASGAGSGAGNDGAVLETASLEFL